MTAVMVVPEDLAAIPPGPALAAVLAGIEVGRVPNNELLPVLRAQSRQAAHEAARLLGVIAEVGRANPTFDDRAVDRLDHPFIHGADEVRAALVWSRRAADSECELAEQVVHELPLVYAAFLAGEIDRPKVRVFADHLTEATAAQIETICASLVPIAGRLTPGQLAHRLRRLLAAVDPRHYERRYRKALRDRSVNAYLDEHGTAVLTVRGLLPAQAAAAIERIDLLAHAARRAGHPSTLDQIRVDIVAGLLDGTLHHLSRDEIIAHLIAHRSANDDGQSGRGSEPAPGDTGAAPGESDPSRHTGGSNPAPGGTGAAPGESDPSRRSDVPREDPRTGVEIRVALSTLLGLDEHPGEIPGLGPVPASHARRVVAAQRRAEWRFAVTGSDGRLVFDGVTRRRPVSLPDTGPPGGIVELHVPATLLERLSGAGAPSALSGRSGGDWSATLADIARQYAARATRDLDAHPHARFPRAGLRRHTEIRDRSCVGPGCRRRPRRCDQDHTVDHQHGGPTVAAGLAPLCRHDHILKHEAGWGLQQPEPGRFLWTSPLGGRYDVTPEPILASLPDPLPRADDPRHDEPAPPAEEVLRVWRPEPPPDPVPPEPSPVDLDDLPPF